MPKKYEKHCGSCPYNNATHLSLEQQKVRSAPLSMEENDGSKLLVFQSPGEVEWTTGRPVSSKERSSAGLRLDKAFGKVGKARRDFNITNAIQCFPGKKEPQAGKKPRDKAPPAKAVGQCGNWLRQDIEGGQYERIVVFGAPAKKAVLALGYEANDPRFVFLKHPTGGLTNESLWSALR